MAGCLNPRNLVCNALLAACTLAVPAFAEELRDPTRPPGIDLAPGTPEASASSGLQSILRRQGRKPLALINGELVPLGGKLGQSTLIEIREDAVVLRTSNGEREIMSLTPAVTHTRTKPLSGK